MAQGPISSRRFEQESMHVYDSGRVADLRRLRSIAQHDIGIFRLSAAVTEFLSKTRVVKNMPQAFCGILLSTEAEACVAANLVDDSGRSNDMRSV